MKILFKNSIISQVFNSIWQNRVLTFKCDFRFPTAKIKYGSISCICIHCESNKRNYPIKNYCRDLAVIQKKRGDIGHRNL